MAILAPSEHLKERSGVSVGLARWAAKMGQFMPSRGYLGLGNP